MACHQEPRSDPCRRCLDLAAEVELLKAQNRGTEWMAARISELEAVATSRLAETAYGRGPDDVESGGQPPRGRLRRALSYLRQRAGIQTSTSRTHPPHAPAPEPAGGPGETVRYPEDRRYPSWVALYDRMDDDARAAIRRRLDALTYQPLVSVVMPVFNTPETYLRQALDSIRSQIYTNWELCVVDDCSTARWISKVLEDYASADPRIRVQRREENGHISAASNSALEMARGTWIALFDHDDIMAEHALALSVLALDAHRDPAILYSDEDHIDDELVRSTPYFKPDFDPILLCGQNYFSHLCVIRRDLVERVGGWRAGYEGSQDWDLVLRVVEHVRADQVVHVPHVLYHWRVHPGSTALSLASKPYAAIAARRAVADHLERMSVPASVWTIGASSFNRVQWKLPDSKPRVSIVALPRSGERLARCLDSIRALTVYENLEVLAIDDGGEWPQIQAFFRDYIDVVRITEPGDGRSDADLLNGAVKVATGDVLCFLDDDVEVVSDNWLEETVGLLLQPGIGAVGAKLLYPEGTVEHAGLVLGIGGTVGHVHRKSGKLEPGYFGRAMLAQCFSAVSRSCMVVRREAFEAVGGFDGEHLSGAYLDVDLCLRLGEAGWRVAWTPFSRLTHHESVTAPRESEGENAVRFAREIRYLQTRWAHVIERDPAYNPNLSLAHETWPLAWPPRVSYR